MVLTLALVVALSLLPLLSVGSALAVTLFLPWPALLLAALTSALEIFRWAEPSGPPPPKWVSRLTDWSRAANSSTQPLRVRTVGALALATYVLGYASGIAFVFVGLYSLGDLWRHGVRGWGFELPSISFLLILAGLLSFQAGRRQGYSSHGITRPPIAEEWSGRSVP